MRYAAILGGILAAMVGGYGGGGPMVQPAHTVTEQMMPRPTKRAMLARRGYFLYQRRPKSKTRTGGGGRVARRVWKKRRASGRH